MRLVLLSALIRLEERLARPLKANVGLAQRVLRLR
jgi:hypothetical protein